MNQLIGFTKKECMELRRTGKLWIVLILFFVFGMMNPGIAKLTPWLFEMMSDTLAEQGIVVNSVEISELTSWNQFYENISLILIVFIVMFGGILVNEYQKGTLINMLTKGLKRWKVIIAKFATVTLAWTIGYWMCFGVTFGYNEYFWGNDLAQHLLFAAVCIYVLGIWCISILLFGSCLFSSNVGGLLTVCGLFGVVYLLSMIPKVAPYMPTQLLGAGNIVKGAALVGDFVKSVFVTISTSIILILAAVACFNRKRV